MRKYHYYHNYWQPVVGGELDCMYERDKQSFWFICYSHQEDNGRNSRTLANGKFENYEVSNGQCKVYRRSHFLTILHLAISSRWNGLEIPCEVWIYLPPTQKENELVGIYDNLIQSQIYLRPESFIIGSFLQTLTEVSTALTANKFKKKDAGKKEKKKKLEKNRIDNQRDIRNFFSAKSKVQFPIKFPKNSNFFFFFACVKQFATFKSEYHFKK